MAQSNPKRWVFLVQKDALQPKVTTDSNSEEKSADSTVVQLRHPRTGKPALFLFSPGDSQIQEVLRFQDGQRSWFFGDCTQADGSFLVCTPMDPLFLVLQYLAKNSQAVPLDHLLIDEKFPSTSRLLNITGMCKRLSSVADQKGDADLQAFVYNEVKTLAWLSSIVRRVAATLESKGHISADGSVSATYIRSQKETTDPASHLRLAFGIIREYLSEELAAKLKAELDLTEEIPKVKRKASEVSTTNSSESASKKSKEEKTEEVLSAPVKATAKAKALAKAAKGTKSISAFFSRKK